MANLGPFGTNNQYIVYVINVNEVNVNYTENYSDVSISTRIYRTNNYTTYGNGTMYCRINGGIHAIGLNTNHKINMTGVTCDFGTHRVYHDSDGSYSVPVSAWISHDRVSSGEQGGSIPLTNIPRQAGISKVTSTGLKDTFTYNWTSNTGAYWYRARVSIPNVIKIKDINLGQQSGGKTNTFTFTSAELTAILNNVSNTSKQVTIGVVIETHTNSSYTSKLGESSEAMVAVSIPTTITVSTPTGKDNNTAIVNLTGNSNYLIQNNSNLLVTVTAATVADCATTTKKATIAKYEVTVNGQTKTLTSAGSLDFGKVTSSTNLLGTLKVIDSRGNSKSVTFTVNVIPYTEPTIKIATCYRSNSDGSENATTGTYVYVKVTFAFCSIKILGVEKNGVKSRTLLIDGTQKSTTFANNVGGTYGTVTSAEHVITTDVTDLFSGTNNDAYTLRSSLLPFVIKKNKKSLGLGGMPTADNQLYIGFNEVNIRGNVQPALKVSSGIVSFLKSEQLLANTSVQGFTYSTSEKWTRDYWIDGKKIYQRTWAVGAKGGTAVASLSLDNINQIWVDMGNSFYIESGSTNAGNRWPINGNLGDTNDAESISAGRGPYYVPGDKKLYWKVPKSGCSNAYITIKYTKTTD